MTSGRVCDGYAPPPPRKKHKKPGSKPEGQAITNGPPPALPGQQASTSYELKLALPRNNSDEVRSFRFFVEITAPSLSGVFDSDFWIGDLPRTCHADAAIWHAVVCLGAAYETYAASRQRGVAQGRRGDPDMARFAMRQFNLAINHLLHTTSGIGEKWRALAASILFTCISSIQGSHAQARIHLKAGRKLLDELDVDALRQQMLIGPPRPSLTEDTALQPPSPPSSSSASSSAPISVRSLRTIVTMLDLHARALSEGPLSYDDFFATTSDPYNVWRYYQPPVSAAPSSSSSSKLGRFRYATAENLVRANRAAESLLNGTLLTQAKYAEDIAGLTAAGEKKSAKMRSLVILQASHRRCFDKLGVALRAFGRELEGGGGGGVVARVLAAPSVVDPVRLNLTKAFLTLKLYQSLTRLFLFQYVAMPGIACAGTTVPGFQGDMADMCRWNREIVDMAEQVLRLTYECNRGAGSGGPGGGASGVGGGAGGARGAGSSAFIPTPSATQALSTVAMLGVPQSERRRAIALLRAYPRREGLWDTAFAASLAELGMAREQEIIAERRRFFTEVAGGDSYDGSDSGVKNEIEREERPRSEVENDDDECVDVLDRQFGARAWFEGETRAKVVLRTWREWLAGEPGKECIVEW